MYITRSTVDPTHPCCLTAPGVSGPCRRQEQYESPRERRDFPTMEAGFRPENSSASRLMPGFIGFLLIQSKYYQVPDSVCLLR